MSQLVKATLLVVGVGLAGPALAETSIYAGAWSTHVADSNDYNETHNLVGLEHDNYFAGYFKNSYGDDSFAVGYRFSYTWKDFDAGIMVGGTYGYRDCLKGYADNDKRVCPAVVPSVSYTAYQIQPTILVLGNAVAFSIKIEL